MSYILEALKKSEQERRRGEVPEINRFDAPDGATGNRSWFWPIVVALLVGINVVVLVVWAPWQEPEVAVDVNSIDPVVDAGREMMPQPAARALAVANPNEDHVRVVPAQPPEAAPRQPVTPAPNAATAQAPQNALEAGAAEPIIIRPRTQRQALPVAESRSAAEVVSDYEERPAEDFVRSVPAPHTSYLPQLQELPASMQRRVPDMSFSSHMYSSEPRFRSIIINGKRLKEGHYLSDEIRVQEITDKGVILSLDGTPFEVDVLGQWIN